MTGDDQGAARGNAGAGALARPRCSSAPGTASGAGGPRRAPPERTAVARAAARAAVLLPPVGAARPTRPPSPPPHAGTPPAAHPRSGCLEEARRLVAAGVSLIPIRGDGSKAPALARWRVYRERRATAAEVARWFRAPSVGLAIIAGAVSGGLEVLDFDEDAAYRQWLTLVADMGLAGVVESLPLVQTPAGGWHLYYRHTDPPAGNQKLAQRLDAAGRRHTLIETRGEGGYVLAPPSPATCHPARRPYTRARGDLAAVPTLAGEQRRMLLAAARALTCVAAPPPAAWPQRRPAPAGGWARPGDLYNRQARWEDLLPRHGWTLVARRGTTGYWRRPGKRRGLSATTDYRGSGFLYVFSSNASPFEPDRAYSPFRAYALLEHAGDFGRAARALALLGYVAPAPPARPPDPFSCPPDPLVRPPRAALPAPARPAGSQPAPAGRPVGRALGEARR